MLKEFNTCFSFLSDIVTQSANPNMLPLVPLGEILTLRNTPPGEKKIGKAIVHISNFSIKYVVASLAGLGIHQWAPDLNEASDTLYKEACRISSIQKFCQIAISGAYHHEKQSIPARRGSSSNLGPTQLPVFFILCSNLILLFGYLPSQTFKAQK
ncbi:hypothetical protein O181_106519 [Austropuccinia psidii MF-1]|uniref:Uncharacterized protein n=1 Tax=Austropuccinia psidii MF-1 TaxID=1389203 RepID=A0A9Q3JRI3_9BASI|nr:hypothetical protein [Austropuccinia psidii MF-1]